MIWRKRFRVGHVEIRRRQVTRGQRAHQSRLIRGCSSPNRVITAPGFHRLEARGVKKMDRMWAFRKDVNDVIRCRQDRIQPVRPDHLGELIGRWISSIAEDGGSKRRFLSPPAARWVYDLSDDGHELAAALVPLARWGVKRLGAPQEGETFSLSWMLLFIQETAGVGVSVHTEFLSADGSTLSTRDDLNVGPFTLLQIGSPAPSGAVSCFADRLGLVVQTRCRTPAGGDR